MDCERARARFVNALSGAAGESELAELRAHAAACAACRAEHDTLTAVWRALGTLRVPAPDRSLPERFERRLRRDEARRRSRPSWAAAGALAATLVLGFGLGYGWRARLTGDAPAPDPSAPPGYLMLLRADAAAPASEPRAVYDEYAAWARALARDGRLVSAEELGQDAAWLISGAGESTAGPTPQAAAQPVVGFFWIQAASLDSAAAQARTSPHLRRGGTIEIRPIQRR